MPPSGKKKKEPKQAKKPNVEKPTKKKQAKQKSDKNHNSSNPKISIDLEGTHCLDTNLYLSPYANFTFAYDSNKIEIKNVFVGTSVGRQIQRNDDGFLGEIDSIFSPLNLFIAKLNPESIKGKEALRSAVCQGLNSKFMIKEIKLPSDFEKTRSITCYFRPKISVKFPCDEKPGNEKNGSDRHVEGEDFKNTSTTISMIICYSLYDSSRMKTNEREGHFEEICFRLDSHARNLPKKEELEKYAVFDHVAGCTTGTAQNEILRNFQQAENSSAGLFPKSETFGIFDTSVDLKEIFDGKIHERITILEEAMEEKAKFLREGLAQMLDRKQQQQLLQTNFLKHGIPSATSQFNQSSILEQPKIEQQSPNPTTIIPDPVSQDLELFLNANILQYLQQFQNQTNCQLFPNAKVVQQFQNQAYPQLGQIPNPAQQFIRNPVQQFQLQPNCQSFPNTNFVQQFQLQPNCQSFPNANLVQQTREPSSYIQQSPFADLPDISKISDPVSQDLKFLSPVIDSGSEDDSESDSENEHEYFPKHNGNIAIGSANQQTNKGLDDLIEKTVPKFQPGVASFFSPRPNLLYDAAKPNKSSPQLQPASLDYSYFVNPNSGFWSSSPSEPPQALPNSVDEYIQVLCDNEKKNSENFHS